MQHIITSPAPPPALFSVTILADILCPMMAHMAFRVGLAYIQELRSQLNIIIESSVLDEVLLITVRGGYHLRSHVQVTNMDLVGGRVVD